MKIENVLFTPEAKEEFDCMFSDWLESRHRVYHSLQAHGSSKEELDYIQVRDFWYACLEVFGQNWTNECRELVSRIGV